MSQRLKFRILGPVVVQHDGAVVNIGGPQPRAVLSLLLLHAHRVVAVDELADALWGEKLPTSFRVQVQGIVSGLRRALGAGEGRAAAPIETAADAYRIVLAPDQLDLEEFRSDVYEARNHRDAGNLRRASALLHQALDRWRGPAFADVSCPAVGLAAIELEEARLSALEDRIGADLDLGRYATLVPELRELLRAYPLRERFHGQLMMALAQSGRFAEAVEIYRRAHDTLVDEAGIEPSDQLKCLHRAILTGSQGTDGDAIRSPGYVVPRQLPRDASRLVGRQELVQTTATALGKPPRGHPALLAVTGPGGIGKTAFTDRLAHRLSCDFPDGQLYAELGTTVAPEAVAGTVLAHFLRSLGVPSEGVPEVLDERTSLFRELLTGRRILIVLDNVVDEAQVPPLIPAEPRCAVLMTSRRRLSGVQDVEVLSLETLTDDDALGLLREIVGMGRVDAEPEAAMRVVRLCGGIPLALHIVGGRLANRPYWTIADMARHLGVSSERLDWLRLGDREVRASLMQSFTALDPDQRRLFRGLGRLEPEIPAWVARLITEDGRSAERLLDDLAEVHLLEPVKGGVTGPRYRMHDLVHLLARELAQGEEDDSAFTRVLHGWSDLTAQADSRLPHWYGLDPAPAPTRRAPANARDAVWEAPHAWLDQEWEHLVHLVHRAADADEAGVAWSLAQSLSTYLDLRGRYDEWVGVLTAALDAAERAGDRSGVACMLGLLVDAEANRDHIGSSMRHAERAWRAYQDLSRPGSVPARPAPLSSPDPRTLRSPEDDDIDERDELRQYAEELAIARGRGDPLTVGWAAYALAHARRDAGEEGGYLEIFEEAARAFAECGARLSELWALKYVGLVHMKEGRLDSARACLARGWAIMNGLGDNAAVARSAGDITLVYVAQGRLDEAEHLATMALRHGRARRNLWSSGKALDTMGDVRRAWGDTGAAIDCYREALRIWRRLGARARVTHTLRALWGLYGDSGFE